MRKHVILIRKGALGDVIWTEPIISYFLKCDYKVIFISRYVSIFRDRANFIKHERIGSFQNLIYKVLSLLFPFKYRFIYLDNAYEQEPKSSIIESYVKKVGFNFSRELNKANFNSLVKSKINKDKKLALFHIQAPSQILNYRSVFGINWNEIAEMLENNGYHAVEIISKSENFNPILKNHLKVDLEELFGAVEQCDLFIGLDSGPAHIANVYKIKSFLFFGSVLPELRLDMQTFIGHIFQNDCEYAGCYHSVTGTRGAICKIVGEFGEPPCCKHTTLDIIEIIKQKI